jgi:biotin carboxylase
MTSRSKTIIIVGGSNSHYPLIQMAKKGGYYTFVFDQDEKCEGAKLADNYVKLSTHDIDGILSKCVEINKYYDLRGITTLSSSPTPLFAVAKICKALNLPSFPLNAVQLATNKMLMKESFANFDVPSPDWIMTDNVNDLAKFVKHANFPLIMKPSAGSMGSQGIALINNESDAIRLFQSVKEYSNDSNVIIEKYYSGEEYSIDGIVVGNTPVVLSISKKYNLGAHYNYTMCGFSINNVSDNNSTDVSSLKVASLKAVSAMGISNSFFSVDVLSTEDGPIVLECGILLDCKVDRLLYYAGLDIYSMVIDVLTGNLKVIEEPKLNMDYALAFMFSDKTGRLVRPEMMDVKNALAVEWERKWGEIVNPPKSIADTLGWVITSSSTGSAYNRAKNIAYSGLFQVHNGEA